MENIKIGILTTSDRAFAGKYEDLSGQAIIAVLKKYIISSWEKVYQVVPDNQIEIENALISMCDISRCCLVFTTGGTGPAKRDVTVEATEKVCQKMLPGFGELMRSISLQQVPTAILSRQTAGIRNGKSLIINLPGKPQSIEMCMQVVFSAVPYCIDLMEGPFIECDENQIKIFRPKS